MKKIITVFLLFLQSLPAFCAITYEACEKYYYGQNFTAARDCIVQYIKVNPADIKAKFLYGEALMRNQEYDKSLQVYNALIKTYPNSPVSQTAQKQITEVQTRKANAASAPKKDYGNYVSELSSNIRWANMPVRIWVQPSPYSQTVLKAFSEWYTATGGLVRFTLTQTESQGRIKVYFVDKKQPVAGGDKAGLCEWKIVGKNIQEAKIYLVYKNENNVTLTNAQIYPTALHEIGHALGIDGHSSNNNDVMYPNTDIIGSHASNRDANTLKAIYGK